MPDFLFLKQATQGQDSKLCGFFALYHFKNGGVTRQQYIDKAAESYTEIGMDKSEAETLALDGNDPAVYKKFGLKEGDAALVDKFEVLIVCDTNRGHFFCMRKIGNEWWDYNSWDRDRPEKIGDAAAAKHVCGTFPVYY